MTSAQAEAWRDALSKVCALWCLLLAVTLLDAVIAKFREPSLVFHALPGDVIRVTGPVAGKAQGMDDLVISADPAAIQINLDAIRPSFWFGGAMWHARAMVRPAAAAGDYPVRIYDQETPAGKVEALHFVVHAGADSYQQSHKSAIRRILNLSPWWLMLVWVGCVVITLLCVYVLAQRVDRLMAEDGRAEIYLMRPVDGGQEIIFEMGSRYGVAVGTRVDVVDKAGSWIGFAEVRKTTENDGLAWVSSDYPVKPGCIVVKK